MELAWRLLRVDQLVLDVHSVSHYYFIFACGFDLKQHWPTLLMPMIHSCTFHCTPQAIVVANAVPEVRRWAQEALKQRGGRPLPQQGGRLVVAQAPVAAGLMEGLEVLGFLR